MAAPAASRVIPDIDIFSWISSKDEPWQPEMMASKLSSEVMSAAIRRGSLLDPQAKVKLLVSLTTLSFGERKALADEIALLCDSALSPDEDEWVRVVSEVLAPFAHGVEAINVHPTSEASRAAVSSLRALTAAGSVKAELDPFERAFVSSSEPTAPRAEQLHFVPLALPRPELKPPGRRDIEMAAAINRSARFFQGPRSPDQKAIAAAAPKPFAPRLVVKPQHRLKTIDISEVKTLESQRPHKGGPDKSPSVQPLPTPPQGAPSPGIPLSSSPAAAAATPGEAPQSHLGPGRPRKRNRGDGEGDAPKPKRHAAKVSVKSPPALPASYPANPAALVQQVPPQVPHVPQAAVSAAASSLFAAASVRAAPVAPNPGALLLLMHQQQQQQQQQLQQQQLLQRQIAVQQAFSQTAGALSIAASPAVPNAASPAPPTGTPSPQQIMSQILQGECNVLDSEGREAIEQFLKGLRPAGAPPVRDVVLNTSKHEFSAGGGYQEQLIFQINYAAGTWRKLKKRTPVASVPTPSIPQ